MHVKVGDRLTHEGDLYEALIEHDTHEGWKPSALTHTVWKKL